MTAADIAKQTAYSAGQLIAAVKATGTEDNVILGHLRDTLRDLGAALGVIVDRVARTQSRQLDGLACVYCGGEDAAMVPAGLGRRGQMFRCLDDCTTPAAALDTSTTNPAYVPDELVNVVLRQRGLAGIFADTEKIRGELAEILVVAKRLDAR